MTAPPRKTLLPLNRSGIALLYLVILFTLAGVLAAAGSRIFSANVNLRKANETKKILLRNSGMIYAWGAKNGRLPTDSEISSVFGGTQVDGWGKNIVYAYDANLTATASGGLCGRTSSAITYAGLSTAFVLISGGDDMSVSSTPSATGAFSGELTGLASEDLYLVTSLNELQSQGGCSASTGGSLKIVNKSLPSACIGASYAATVVAEGGVGAKTYAFGALPDGIIATNGALSAVTVTAAAGSPTVTVTVEDSQAPAKNSVSASFILKVVTCP